MLREHKTAIRSFIREHWSDQKLAEVYCFNRDGLMDMWWPCACILGVTLANSLHSSCCAQHYSAVRLNLNGAEEAEDGYMWLGYQKLSFLSPEASGLRQRRLSAILRAEMRHRERARKAEQRMYQTADTKNAIALEMLLGALADRDAYRVQKALVHIESIRHLAAMTAPWTRSESREAAGVEV